MPTFQEQTIQLLHDMVISRYMIGAGLALMMYDWLLTLPDEWRYIWRARWSKVKIIFLTNRYMVPLVLGFAAYGWSGNATFLSPLSCKIWVSVDSAIQLAFFATLHWIVAMRAWTLYGRTVLTALIIWGGFVLYLGAATYLLAKAMIALEISPVPFVNVCFGNIPQFIWSCWLPSMVFETLVFVLTAVKAVYHNRHRVETPILTILYRDGFLYFIFICVNSFLNLLVWAIAPPSDVLLVKYFTMAICQVAGSHLILDLIEVGHLTGASNRSDTTTNPGPNMPFPPNHPRSRSRRTATKPHSIKRPLRAHGGDDAYEMMPSPSPASSPHFKYPYPSFHTRELEHEQQKRQIETYNSWKAPAEWDYEDEYPLEKDKPYEKDKGIRTILREASLDPDGLSQPTKSVQWVDRRCYVSPGSAL